jgi:uncharacterized protein
MNLFKAILITLGTLSLLFGLIGIMVPGLPTTPLLLLTAGLYVRSSEKLYNKLISNRIVGSYIVEFRANKGMTRIAKISVISLMWIMILISVLFLINHMTVRIIVLLAGITGTVVMGLIVPTTIK